MMCSGSGGRLFGFWTSLGTDKSGRLGKEELVEAMAKRDGDAAKVR